MRGERIFSSFLTVIDSISIKTKRKPSDHLTKLEDNYKIDQSNF